MERSLGLEIRVRAHAAMRDTAQAREALQELTDLARRARTPALRATVLRLEGVVSAADGDHDAARLAFEDALDALARTATPLAPPSIWR